MKALKILIDNSKTSLCDSNGNPSHLREEVLPAMEEYAEHKTILFMKYIGMSESKEGRTFEELYTDFNQKIQNNDKLQN